MYRIVFCHGNRIGGGIVSALRHVAPLEHIILIPGRPVFALSYLYCVLSGEATNNNFIDFGLTIDFLLYLLQAIFFI
jgi:hypothetical protein